MMRRRSLAVGIALCLCALPVHAQDDEEEEDDFGRPGLYVGAMGIHAFQNFYVKDRGYFRDLSPSIPNSYDNSFGFNVRAGYRAQDHFAAEFEYEYVNGFDRTDTSIRTHVFTANAKLPFTTGRFQPFLGYGLGFMSASQAGASDLNFAMRAYGGIDIYIDNNWMVQLESSYVFPIGNVRGLDYVTAGFLGVAYRF